MIDFIVFAARLACTLEHTVFGSGVVEHHNPRSACSDALYAVIAACALEPTIRARPTSRAFPQPRPTTRSPRAAHEHLACLVGPAERRDRLLDDIAGRVLKKLGMAAPTVLQTLILATLERRVQQAGAPSEVNRN